MLAKVRVVSSNLIARSKFQKDPVFVGRVLRHFMI